MNTLIYVVVLLSTFLGYTLCRERESTFTIEVVSARVECFYETIKESQIIDIDYQVLHGGGGEIDINFYSMAPNGKLIAEDRKMDENSHRITAKESGDYRFCFDNTISRFNTKLITFTLIVESDDGEEVGPWRRDEDGEMVFQPEVDHEVAVEELQKSVNKLRGVLSRVQFFQGHLRAFEARDRNLGELNFSRVNNFSLFFVLAMLMTGAIQIILIRSFFDSKSRLHGKW